MGLCLCWTRCPGGLSRCEGQLASSCAASLHRFASGGGATPSASCSGVERPWRVHRQPPFHLPGSSSSSQLHPVSPLVAEPSPGLCPSHTHSLSLDNNNFPARSLFATPPSPLHLVLRLPDPSTPRWPPSYPRKSVCLPHSHCTHATHSVSRPSQTQAQTRTRTRSQTQT